MEPTGISGIDAAIAQRLLSLALERGGDYADLFFEYRVGADVVLEDERIKSLGRGITMGLGVRVLRGDATGYAYSEDLSWELAPGWRVSSRTRACRAPISALTNAKRARECRPSSRRNPARASTRSSSWRRRRKRVLDLTTPAAHR